MANYRITFSLDLGCRCRHIS